MNSPRWVQQSSQCSGTWTPEKRIDKRYECSDAAAHSVASALPTYPARARQDDRFSYAAGALAQARELKSRAVHKLRSAPAENGSLSGCVIAVSCVLHPLRTVMPATRHPHPRVKLQRQRQVCVAARSCRHMITLRNN